MTLEERAFVAQAKAQASLFLIEALLTQLARQQPDRFKPFLDAQAEIFEQAAAKIPDDSDRPLSQDALLLNALTQAMAVLRASFNAAA